MLRINQQRSSHGAKGYFNDGLEKGDYYTQRRNRRPLGREGSRPIGLHGSVTQEAFHALCDNQNPVSGRKLTCRTRENRSVAYDFTFNAPKSLSLLYTLTKDQRLLGCVPRLGAATR